MAWWKVAESSVEQLEEYVVQPLAVLQPALVNLPPRLLAVFAVGVAEEEFGLIEGVALALPFDVHRADGLHVFVADNSRLGLQGHVLLAEEALVGAEGAHHRRLLGGWLVAFKVEQLGL
jgi:hypothetical protein